MALDTNIVHPETGGVALVEREAFDKIYSRKGWQLASPEEANEAAQALIAERDKVQREAAESSAAQQAAELAAAGALPKQAEEVTAPAPTTKKSAAAPPASS